MFRFVAAITLALCSVACARMAYQLPGGAENILRARSYTETFSCEGLPYGYYADVDNNCEIFHICLPITGPDGSTIDMAHFSFICGNQTIFNQESLTCTFEEDAVPCAEARTLYELSNADFGKIPEEGEQSAKAEFRNVPKTETIDEEEPTVVIPEVEEEGVENSTDADVGFGLDASR